MPIAAPELLLFAASSAMLALAPGPDIIFVLTQSMIHGRSSGMAVTFGLCTGLLFHTALAALGIAALLKASPAAFTVLKITGAAYLIYLAYKTAGSVAPDVKSEDSALPSHRSYYTRGIFMNITNPKVSLFFLAYLPQFADTSKGSVTVQMLLLGLVFIVATLAVFTAVSALAAVIGAGLNRSPAAGKVLNYAAASIYILLAVKLLFTTN